jgi:hypothetical protein
MPRLRWSDIAPASGRALTGQKQRYGDVAVSGRSMALSTRYRWASARLRPAFSIGVALPQSGTWLSASAEQLHLAGAGHAMAIRRKNLFTVEQFFPKVRARD